MKYINENPKQAPAALQWINERGQTQAGLPIKTT